MKIAVLGAGPSGMMAAHAASEFGHHITILDKEPDKTRRNSGVFFLHDDCNLALDEVHLKQRVLGAFGKKNADDISRAYGVKVYGRALPKTSIISAMRAENANVIGYNAEQAIDRLWDLYGSQVKPYEFLGSTLSEEALFNRYDKVISTIPAKLWYPSHAYSSVTTWIKIGTAPKDEGFIFYNINPHSKWYRCSAMLGTFVQEYGAGFKPHMAYPYSYVFRTVTKVIGVDRPFPETNNLFLVGRYGAWDKSCLTHNVYHRTLDWLMEER